MRNAGCLIGLHQEIVSEVPEALSSHKLAEPRDEKPDGAGSDFALPIFACPLHTAMQCSTAIDAIMAIITKSSFASKC